jgi:predicted ribonuclease YlaK
MAIGELGSLRKSLASEDAREFTRAIGLAAHGVGIGSFVYLRRVFEKLIDRRFRAHEAEIDADQYARSRMVEKIDLLKAHLPTFMVENKSIYGILSKGVHTLSDEICRQAFPMMRDTIVMILEEDARAIEDRRKRDELSKSINALGSFLALAPEVETQDKADT